MFVSIRQSFAIIRGGCIKLDGVNTAYQSCLLAELLHQILFAKDVPVFC